MSRLRRALMLARSLQRPDPTGLTPKQVADLVRQVVKSGENLPDPKRMTVVQLEAAIEAALEMRQRHS